VCVSLARQVSDPGGGLEGIRQAIDLKIAALRAHKSQMNDWDPEPRIREWSAQSAKGKEMAYAESFRVITLESDEDWEERKGKVG